RTGPASPRRSVCAPGALALLLDRRPAVRSSLLRAGRTQAMSCTTVFRWLTRSGSGRRGRGRWHRPTPKPSFVPRLLALEDRTLPSVFSVTTLADSGAGSLRQAILDANATPGDDTITFAVTGTINLASALPNLSSNIDLQGPGARDLTVRGQ